MNYGRYCCRMKTEKDILKQYLQTQRETLLWKLDGASERDIRRPMTQTGTNLLGIVKHVASVEIGYFGDCFGRPSGEPLPWFEDGAPDNADMWATASESRESIIALYHRSWEHSDRTIDELELDAVGDVPWWSEERRTVTLHTILVHMITETARHAGHADILRELIDGAAGYMEGGSNLPDHDAQWWADYVEQLERAAEDAANGLAQ
jgi:uncharacterized damage-inducible protein DinB